MSELRFTVYGRPVPQGSSKGFPIRRANGKLGVAITHDNERTVPYRQDIAHTAAELISGASMAIPAFGGDAVTVQASFFFARPKSLKKSVAAKTTKPDTDKCLRSVLDALSGICFHDDAQVTKAIATKHFGLPERTEICVSLTGNGEVAEELWPAE